MDLFFGTNEISNSVAVLRLAFSLLAGGIIGFERERRRQSAGLRTHILICLGATLLMILSVWLPAQYFGSRVGDPGRIAAQVVSGIGFLGAGSIIRLGNTIKGLTTAASLWFIAAIGLAIGAGLYIPAGIALVLSLFALVVLEPIERRFFPTERLKHLVIAYTGDSHFPEAARHVIEQFGLHVQSVDVERNLKKNESVASYLVSMPLDADPGELYRLIKAMGGVQKVNIKENF